MHYNIIYEINQSCLAINDLYSILVASSEGDTLMWN